MIHLLYLLASVNSHNLLLTLVSKSFNSLSFCALYASISLAASALADFRRCARSIEFARLVKASTYDITITIIITDCNVR